MSDTTVPPGGVVYLSNQSSYSGVYFQAGGPDNPRVNMLASGKHVFLVSFQNPEDGKTLGQQAWTGTAVANEVSLDVE